MATTKTPQELLKELEQAAEQSKKDAEIVRAYIELQSRRKNKLTIVMNGDAKPFFQPVQSELKDRFPHLKKNIVDYIKKENRFVKYAEIQNGLRSLYKVRNEEEYSKALRDTLRKDKKLNKPSFVKIPIKGAISKFYYGLPEFMMGSSDRPYSKYMPNE